MKRTLIGAVTLLFTCVSFSFSAEIRSYSQFQVMPPVADNGEILIDFADEQSSSSILDLFGKLGLQPGQYTWFSREEKWFRLRNVTAQLLTKLKGRKDIEAIEPNYYLSALFVPNDPYYKHQWHLDLIGMRKAWDYPPGAPVTVAVIDTGIAYENFKDRFKVEDLGGSQFVSPYNFVSGNAHANDDHGHGTHVAGTIAQLTNNGLGVAGVAPFVKLMPLKVLNSYGYGTISDIAAAIRYAADNGASIINMSLGGPFPSFILHKACKYAYNKGVVIVCAAGNSGRSGLSYPARYPECISVSAVRFDRQLTWYSSYGKGLTIAAPGGDMNVDQNEDGLMDGVLQNTLNPQDPSQQGYFLFQGTSMAAPHVAAGAALLASHGIKDPDKVRQYLQRTASQAEDGSSEEYGAGVLSADAALRSAFYYRNARLLVLACILFVLLVSVLNRRRKTDKVPVNALAVVGLMFGSTGLFFLPRIPYFGQHFLLTHPAFEWPLLFLGAVWFGNALLLSALPALLLTILSYPWKRLVPLSFGFSCGMAGFLSMQAISPTTGIAWIPGSVLEFLWLLGNAVVCTGLCVIASFRLR